MIVEIKKSALDYRFLLVVAICLFLAFIRADISKQVAMPVMVTGLAVICGLVLLWTIQKRMSTGRILILIASAGFLLRIGYTLYTGVDERQHDVYSFYHKEGHAGYIVYLYHNYRLPDFDPRTIPQYYHPPLHHAIVAFWLKLNRLMGVGWEQPKENIQMLTLFYSMSYLLLSLKIFREIGLKEVGLVLAFSVIAFHPTFLILSGSINNDMLSILLMLGGCYYTIRWYKDPSVKNILKIALCIGFGMMAKLTVVLIAPAVALVLLSRFLSEKSHRWKFIQQYIMFAVLCIPLGLWWEVRNLILFQVPITYVQKLGPDSRQYIGDYTVYQRLFDWSAYQFKNLYVAWGTPYFEHNIFLTLLKTSVFGESDLGAGNPYMGTPSAFLFYSHAVLVGVSLFAMGWVIFKKTRDYERIYKVFFSVLLITFMASYIRFCFAFPHTCTQNIRYVTLAIFVGALSIGVLAGQISQLNKGWKTMAMTCIVAPVVLFVGSSATVFTLLGLK